MPFQSLLNDTANLYKHEVSPCPDLQATKDTWRAYEEHAMGFDELMPVTKMGKNNWGSMGATVVDSLDTLWLMGLKEEFDRSACSMRMCF